MALVTSMRYDEQIPHEPGESMRLRVLSWKELEAAREARTTSGINRAKQAGGELLTALQGINPREVEEAAKDPLNDYDWTALLRAGIVSWSYTEDLSFDSIDLLDEPTARWACRAHPGDLPAAYRGGDPGFYVSFQLALDDRPGGLIPPAWIISRMCEEFPALTPTAAIRELEEAPVNLISDILGLREYVRSRRLLDQAQDETRLEITPGIERVWEVQHYLLLRSRAHAAGLGYSTRDYLIEQGGSGG